MKYVMLTYIKLHIRVIYICILWSTVALRLGLLAATATPLQHHNPLASLFPTHRLVGLAEHVGYGRAEGAVKPYIYMRTYIYITKAKNKHVDCYVLYFLFLVIQCGQRITNHDCVY